MKYIYSLLADVIAAAAATTTTTSTKTTQAIMLLRRNGCRLMWHFPRNSAKFVDQQLSFIITCLKELRHGQHILKKLSIFFQVCCLLFV